ncbi:hypothetical protein Hdeb2414_s0003g00116051 [Helianthus debilis subsp. tardiflorus]
MTYNGYERKLFVTLKFYHTNKTSLTRHLFTIIELCITFMGLGFLIVLEEYTHKSGHIVGKGCATLLLVNNSLHSRFLQQREANPSPSSLYSYDKVMLKVGKNPNVHHKQNNAHIDIMNKLTFVVKLMTTRPTSNPPRSAGNNTSLNK